MSENVWELLGSQVMRARVEHIAPLGHLSVDPLPLHWLNSARLVGNVVDDLGAVELRDFYQKHSRPALIRVWRGEPGYMAPTPGDPDHTLVMVFRPSKPLTTVAPIAASPVVKWQEDPTDDWLTLWQNAAGWSVPNTHFRAMLSRSTARNAYGEAVVDGQIVGTVRATIHQETGHVGIFHLGVSEEHRGLGIGRSLLTAVTTAHPADEYYLFVDTDNPTAMGLYERAGFEVAHEYSYLEF